MKFKITSLFILILAVLSAGCLKNTDQAAPTGLVVPSGSFAGQFQLIHYHPSGGKYDTTYADCQLLLNPDLTFTLTGDTTKILGAGHGTYSTDQTSNLMSFVDQTVSKAYTLNSPKKHLNGLYLYNLTSTSLTIGGTNDTLSLVYTLLKK